MFLLNILNDRFNCNVKGSAVQLDFFIDVLFNKIEHKCTCCDTDLVINGCF